MLILLSWIARLAALIFGAALGWTIGFFAAIFAGDGDVGSAFLAFITMPTGLLIGAIGGFTIASLVLRRRGY